MGSIDGERSRVLSMLSVSDLKQLRTEVEVKGKVWCGMV